MASPELTKLSVDNAPATRSGITPEGNAAAGRIAEFRQNIDNGATAKEARATVKQIIAGPQGISSIPPSDLRPQAVVNIPQPAVPTQGAAIAAEAADSVDQFTQQQQAAAEQAGTVKESALNTYLTNLTQQKGLTQLTDAAYRADGGVDDITGELNLINDDIRKEQLGLRRAIEAITAAGGQSKAQASAQIANKERESYAKQADMTITQLGVQGRYDAAVAQADRAVAAQLEQQTNYNAALKFAYDEAKSDWSTAEQREFETLLGNRERALQEESDRLKAIKELGIQAQIDGAPTDVVQKMLAASTEAEALAAGGQYIGALDREQQRASIEASIASAASSRQSASASRTNQLLALAEAGDVNAMAELGITPKEPSEYEELDRKGAAAVQKEIVSNPNYEAVQKAQTSINALDAYIKVFEEVGTTSGVTSPFDNARLTKVHKAALLDLKEFFNLGVLNGPDLDVLTDVLGDPTSQGFVTNPAAKAGAIEGIKQMKAKLSETLDDRFLSVSSQYSNYNPADVPLIEDTQRVYLQTKAKLDPAVQKLIDENPDMQVSEVLQIINSKL